MMILLIREIAARYALDLFMFVAPAKMKRVYANHLYVAAMSYTDIIKDEK